MTRFPDWQQRLDRFVVANSARTFRYGSWDCCLFVCDAIFTMTGIDPAAAFRGGYEDRKGAMQLVREKYGRASVRAVTEGVTRDLGLQECPVRMAQRGDLVIIKRPSDCSLGIVDLTGQQVLVLKHTGIDRIPLTLSTKAWHV